MIPQLSHIENFNELAVWITTNGRAGFVAEISGIDFETTAFEKTLSEIRNWCQKTSPQVLIRIRHQASLSFEPIGCVRGTAFSKFGATVSKTLLSIEVESEPLVISEIKRFIKKTAPIQAALEVLKSASDSLRELGLLFRVYSECELQELFNYDPKSWLLSHSYLETSQHYKAVLRLIKPSGRVVAIDLLEKLSREIPKPFEISVSFRRFSNSETQVYLLKKMNQSSQGKDRTSHLRLAANEEALQNTFLEGDSLFQTEFQIVLEREDPSELKRDSNLTRSYLSLLGDVLEETFGLWPSLAASMTGSAQHVYFLESGKNLPYYLPLTARGTPSDLRKIEVEPLSGLSVHRENDSRGDIHILSPEHLNANALIIGASGRGKSALVGILTECLLNDPNVSLIKVDVGGSHSRECELLGGTEYLLSMDTPSGINPFEILSAAPDGGSGSGGVVDESVRAILCNFLSVLVLDEGELSPPKSVRIELDEKLKEFIGSRPENVSLNSFYEFATDFSRKKLLSRWVPGGMYGNSFRAVKNEPGPQARRLRYYNFSEVFQAQDPEFAQAGMAAVLAQFNMEMRNNPKMRIVLICDETPFFIHKCFEFFKFSAANVRKFGAALVLVVQNSENLIVGGDTGIIENSFHRFLMSTDGDIQEYQARFKLSGEQLESISSLRSIPRKFSEFFYQFGEKGFKARLRLTSEEYWRVTTTAAEKQKIQKLMQAVPELNLSEALACLALKV